jgi:geranylgeranyl pyrophosphate synthase
LKSAMLEAELRRAIDLYFGEPLVRQAVRRALARSGFALHSEAPCRAGVLTLEVYRVISGPPSVAAIQAAVAVELHMQAAYLFDSVADRDKSPSDDLSPAEELALAIGLLSAGQSAVGEAAFMAGRSGSGLRSLQQWYRDCIGSVCAGQFLDAYLEKRDAVTAEEALKMTSLKAGGLGRLAAGLGAGMATEDQEIVDRFGEFGFHLFTYSQLIDDLRDACPAPDLPSDLIQGKKTLPVVFFHNSLAEERSKVARGIISQETQARITADISGVFESSGARIFGAIVAEAFLNRAKNNLADIKSRLGTVGNLENIVGSFEISPQEVGLAA